jgi:hypothetical protein
MKERAACQWTNGFSSARINRLSYGKIEAYGKPDRFEVLRLQPAELLYEEEQEKSRAEARVCKVLQVVPEADEA